MPQTLLLAPERLKSFTASLLSAAGVAEEEAVLVAASLIEANLRGHDSHGVVRVPEYLRQLQTGQLRSGAALRVQSETPSMLAIDAGLGFGFVQMRRLIERLLPKAQQNGLAGATACRCGHVGRLGEWVEHIAQRGYASLMSVNDNGVLQCVAPPGATAPRISTNPVAIGVPTGEEPLVLDISTSVVANGKIKVAYLAGGSCPPGWLQDHEGRPTSEPKVRFEEPYGTILPLGGRESYKGFGLGLLLDILVGGLSGGFCPPAPAEAKVTNNVLLVVWNPRHFAGRDHFLHEADKLIQYVRQSPRKDGIAEIRLPGDRSRRLREQREQEGIPLEGGTWTALCEWARRLGVEMP